MKDRGLLISLSIIIGLVLSCAILPLGAFALALAAAGSNTNSGPSQTMTWGEQIVEESDSTDRIVILMSPELLGHRMMDLG